MYYGVAKIVGFICIIECHNYVGFSCRVAQSVSFTCFMEWHNFYCFTCITCIKRVTQICWFYIYYGFGTNACWF